MLHYDLSIFTTSTNFDRKMWQGSEENAQMQTHLLQGRKSYSNFIQMYSDSSLSPWMIFITIIKWNTER